MSSQASIKERLQQATTEHDLDVVLHDIWAFGSPNWNLDSVIRFLPPHLWEPLKGYFDKSGRLLHRFPARGEGEPQASQVTPAEQGAVDEIDASDDWLERGSLSDIIASFHDRLAAIRRGEASVVPACVDAEHATSLVDEVLFDSLETNDWDDTESDEPLPHAKVKKTRIREAGELCPICLKRYPELVEYRAKVICASCVALLRRS